MLHNQERQYIGYLTGTIGDIMGDGEQGYRYIRDNFRPYMSDDKPYRHSIKPIVVRAAELEITREGKYKLNNTVSDEDYSSSTAYPIAYLLDKVYVELRRIEKEMINAYYEFWYKISRWNVQIGCSVYEIKETT